MDFREAGPGDMQKTSGRTIDSIEVTPPTSREATLHIVIQSNGITVEFDGRTTWQPADPDNRTEWLPAGGMSVGLTGQGGEFSVRNYSIRMID